MGDLLFDINHRKTRSSTDDQNKKRVTNHYISIYFNIAEPVCPTMVERNVKAAMDGLGVGHSAAANDKEEPNFTAGGVEAQNRHRSRSPFFSKKGEIPKSPCTFLYKNGLRFKNGV